MKTFIVKAGSGASSLQPVEDALVFKEPNGPQGFTDSAGRVTFESGVIAGDSITIARVGFKPKQVNADAEDVQVVTLESSGETELPEVVVTGEIKKPFPWWLLLVLALLTIKK